MEYGKEYGKKTFSTTFVSWLCLIYINIFSFTICDCPSASVVYLFASSDFTNI